MAKLRIRAGRTAEAARPLSTLARRQRGTTELLLLSYRMALATGDQQQAQFFRDRSEYNAKKMPLDPVPALAQQVRNRYGIDKLGRRAERLLQQKNWDAAAPLLQTIVDAKQDRHSMLPLNTALIGQGQPQSAIAQLEAIMRDQGQFPQGMFYLGQAYLAAGETDRARQLWETTTQLDSVGQLHQELAELYKKQGNQSSARRQQALAAQATGIAGLRKGNPAGARKYLERAVKLDDSLPTAWFYLGECQRLLGNRPRRTASLSTGSRTPTPPRPGSGGAKVGFRITSAAISVVTGSHGLSTARNLAIGLPNAPYATAPELYQSVRSYTAK